MTTNSLRQQDTVLVTEKRTTAKGRLPLHAKGVKGRNNTNMTAITAPAHLLNYPLNLSH